MEKFKRFTDPPSGINPYVPRLQASAVARVSTFVCFPLRPVLALPFVVLLFVADFLVLVLRLVGLTVVANAVVGPPRAFLLRGLLWAMAGLALKRRCFPPRPFAGAAAAADALPGTVAATDEPPVPKPGDVVLCNCQSTVDVLALEALFPEKAVPFRFVFPKRAEGSTEKIAFTQCTSVWAAMSHVAHMSRAADTMAAGDGSVSDTPVAAPTPLSKVFQQPVAAPAGGAQMVTPFSLCNADLVPLQERALADGVALVVFAEGVTTNGRGLLAFPSIRCRERLHLVTLQYDASSVPTVVPASLMSDLFRMPMGGSALGLLGMPSGCHGTIVRPSVVPPAQTVFSPVWSNDVRSVMCRAACSHNSQVLCKALSVSVDEKHAFQKHWKQTFSRA